MGLALEGQGEGFKRGGAGGGLEVAKEGEVVVGAEGGLRGGRGAWRAIDIVREEGK